jgi:type III secretory pathway component EscV
MLQVQGRSDLFLFLEIIKKTIAIGPLIIGAFVGIMPMLYVNIATGIIAFFLNSHYSGRHMGYSSWKQIKDIAPSYGVASFVSVVVFFMKYLPLTYWAVLSLQIICGFVILYFIYKLSGMKEFVEIKEIVQPYILKKH